MSGPAIGSPNLLQSVFDNVDAALVVIDNEGKLVFSNPAFASIFGVRREQNPVHIERWASTLLGRGYRFQDDRGVDIDIDASKIRRTLAGEQIQPCDFRLIFPDRTWKWIHATTHLFSCVGLTGVLVIATDETVHIELRNIAGRAERLETLGAVSRALAHDFNNLLEVISANTYLGLAQTDVPETIRTSLQAIVSASQQATKLVKRLIQFGRPHTPEMRPIQLNDVITDVLQLIRPLLRYGIQVKTDLSPILPMVNADPLQMGQLLVNLIVNALDAMPHGGQLILSTEIEQGETPASTRGRAQGGAVLISIADTGIGIPAAVQSQVFEPFFTTKERGTGLGLSSVYGIVREHSGDIAVHSEPTKGTTFLISLPAIPASQL